MSAPRPPPQSPPYPILDPTFPPFHPKTSNPPLYTPSRPPKRPLQPSRSRPNVSTHRHPTHLSPQAKPATKPPPHRMGSNPTIPPHHLANTPNFEVSHPNPSEHHVSLPIPFHHPINHSQTKGGTGSATQSLTFNPYHPARFSNISDLLMLIAQTFRWLLSISLPIMHLRRMFQCFPWNWLNNPAHQVGPVAHDRQLTPSPACLVHGLAEKGCEAGAGGGCVLFLGIPLCWTQRIPSGKVVIFGEVILQVDGLEWGWDFTGPS